MLSRRKKVSAVVAAVVAAVKQNMLIFLNYFPPICNLSPQKEQNDFLA